MFIHNLLLSLSLLNSLPNVDQSHCNDARGRRLEQRSYLTKDVKVIYNVRTRDKVAFITIDDGVYVSDSLAKFIDDNQLPITTFALAGELWRNRDWFTQRTNMTFENHTNTHAHMTLIDQKQQGYEICRASQVVRNVTGERPVFFRPPGGSWNEEVRASVGQAGIKYIAMWNVQVDKGKILNRGRNSLSPGDIVLLHYTHGLERDLKVLLTKMKQDGLEPALLRDYLK